MVLREYLIIFLIYLFTSTITLFTLLQPFSFPYHFISPLFFQFFSLPYLFISPLPSTLILFSIFPFIFLYFCLFLFTLSYYKFVTISFILCIVFPYKKKGSLSLSLSLTHTPTIFEQIFIFYFIFLASLFQVDNFLYSLIYFRLMRFSVFFFLSLSLIVKCYPIAL